MQQLLISSLQSLSMQIIEQLFIFNIFILDCKYNTIINEKHPAWYARTGNKMSHSLFTTISNMCMDKYGIPIKWYEEEHF